MVGGHAVISSLNGGCVFVLRHSPSAERFKVRLISMSASSCETTLWRQLNKPLFHFLIGDNRTSRTHMKMNIHLDTHAISTHRPETNRSTDWHTRISVCHHFKMKQVNHLTNWYDRSLLMQILFLYIKGIILCVFVCVCMCSIVHTMESSKNCMQCVHVSVWMSVYIP